MILNQDLASLLFTTFTDQTSWAFGNDDDSKQLDSGHETLQSSRQDPLPSPGLVPQCPKANPSSDDTTKVPKCIINSRDLSSMSRMRDLGDEKGVSRVRDVGAAPHDGSTDEV